MNLISNSFKFTNQGHIRVTVHRPLFSDSLEFEVADTGIGISDSDTGGLFQMFGMVHKHRDEFNMKGTGLGLTISQKLVERMGGKIKLNSEENKGTTVVFTVQEDYQNKQNSILFEGKKMIKEEEKEKRPILMLRGIF